MKKIFSLFLIMGVLLVLGCSDNATGPNTGGLGGGGTTGGVTFTIGQTQGSQQGSTMFTLKPSVDVTITTITAKLPAQQFEDLLTNPNPDAVVSSQNTYELEEYTGVQAGQQWQFVFVGKIGSSTGAAYTVTANYTVQ
ncbi:MAG: hypothetical protein IPJ23_14440 [Ignavibacteriales bacterium]|jgi:hypothetical protein|nr:hypothetical protein [Ignavibacteriales bacterium]